MSLPLASNSRFTILSWINDTLLLPLTRIQQLGSGSVYCQLLDAAYPQRVPLNKVKWDAKLQVEFLHNFKILITSFQYLGITKKIDIQRLAKAKYQDNLEFVQWFKGYIQDKIDYQNYQPLKRRNNAKLYVKFVDKKNFNVSQHQNQNQSTTNKQNIDNSICYMKSSIKTNVTMNSSVMLASRASTANLLNIQNKNNKASKNTLKTLPDQSFDQPCSQITNNITCKKQPEKRKNVGPLSYLTLNNKKNQVKNMMKPSLKPKAAVKNVQVIQSQGSADQFF